MDVDVEQIVRENLDRTFHMSLATVSGDAPWVCEVHFAYDENLNLYFRSLKTRRHSQEIAANPNVAGNIIDNYELGAEILGLYFEGTAVIVEGDEAKAQAAEIITNRLHIPADILEDSKNENGHQFYKITVKNWYVFGRFGGPSGQKLSLEWNGGNR